MNFTILDPTDLLDNGIFKEDAFLAKVEDADWLLYQGKKVLVRGCTSAIVPPWAYMLLTAKLTNVAKSIRFGNEHDHIVVYRDK